MTEPEPRLDRRAARAGAGQPAARRRDPGRGGGAAGGVVYLVRHGGRAAGPPRHSTASRPSCATPSASCATPSRGEPRGLIQLGLLLLIATPVARVVFSVFAFARQRDWIYVVITLIVLAVLLYSLFWGT